MPCRLPRWIREKSCMRRSMIESRLLHVFTLEPKGLAGAWCAVERQHNGSPRRREQSRLLVEVGLVASFLGSSDPRTAKGDSLWPPHRKGKSEMGYVVESEGLLCPASVRAPTRPPFCFFSGVLHTWLQALAKCSVVGPCTKWLEQPVVHHLKGANPKTDHNLQVPPPCTAQCSDHSHREVHGSEHCGARDPLHSSTWQRSERLLKVSAPQRSIGRRGCLLSIRCLRMASSLVSRATRFPWYFSVFYGYSGLSVVLSCVK